MIDLSNNYEGGQEPSDDKPKQTFTIDDSTTKDTFIEEVMRIQRKDPFSIPEKMTKAHQELTEDQMYLPMAMSLVSSSIMNTTNTTSIIIATMVELYSGEAAWDFLQKTKDDPRLITKDKKAISKLHDSLSFSQQQIFEDFQRMMMKESPAIEQIAKLAMRLAKESGLPLADVFNVIQPDDLLKELQKEQNSTETD